MSYDAVNLLYATGRTFPQSTLVGYDADDGSFNVLKVDAYGHLFQDSYVWDTDTMAWIPASPSGGSASIVGLKNLSETQINPATEDSLVALVNFYTVSPFVGYVVCDMEEVKNGYSYYGYVSVGGAWYIRRYDDTIGSMRFAKGTSNYGTAWTNRTSLSYTLPS